MGVQRIFLGWQHHLLHGAAEYLVTRFTAGEKLDLRGVTLVFPGGRAGRRLTELLVERAEERALSFYPPRTITIGALPELLYTPPLPLAGELERMMAWYGALTESTDEVKRLMPAPPPREDLGAWLGLVQQIIALTDELGGAALTACDTAQRAPELDLFNDERWEALAAIEARYIARFETRGKTDKNQARLAALRDRRVVSPGEVILVGVADMNPLQKGFIELLGEGVTALIYAEEKLAPKFDRLGAIEITEWIEAPLPIEKLKLDVRAGPRETALGVLDAIASAAPAPSAEEVTIGVCDPTIAPVIAETVQRRGIKVFRAEGAGVTSTPPLTFLDAAARYVGSSSYFDLSSLIRHPDVQRWLSTAPGIETNERWILHESIGVLDRYHEEHLQARVGEAPFGDSNAANYARRLTELVHELIAELRGPKRPVAAWAEPIACVAARLYDDRTINRFAAKDAVILHGVQALQEALAELYRFDEPEIPSIDAGEAIRLVLRRLHTKSVELTRSEAAVEIVGWLELPFDDAREIIVTGCNEGFVPESLNSDPFLPESLRRALGLLHNDRRYARDAFALTALAEGPARVTIIQARRSSSGDPLKPSRLLLTGEPENAARMLQAFYAPLPEAVEHSAASGASRFTIPPPPMPLESPITELSVSAFKGYLQCPYRFYLRHVLRLRRHDDGAYELSPLDFGVLAHDVLKNFASSPAAASADRGVVEGFLLDELSRLGRERFGDNALPVVFVQLRQLAERFKNFARWQAARTGEGWRIAHAELNIEAGLVQLPVSKGPPMTIVGRIDRIDHNPSTGEWAIFDYKVSDGELDAKKAHLHPTEGWLDLQLPLYHLAFTKMGLGTSAALGYILLSASGDDDVSLAEFTPTELDEAAARAVAIAEMVRNEIFGPPTSEVLPFDDFAAVCGAAQFHANDGGAP